MCLNYFFALNFIPASDVSLMVAHIKINYHAFHRFYLFPHGWFTRALKPLHYVYLKKASLNFDSNKRLNIRNSIVIVNDFLVKKRYKDWCEENGEQETIKANHSLSSDQISWFFAGSALNYIKSK